MSLLDSWTPPPEFYPLVTWGTGVLFAVGLILILVGWRRRELPGHRWVAAFLDHRGPGP